MDLKLLLQGRYIAGAKVPVGSTLRFKSKYEEVLAGFSHLGKHMQVLPLSRILVQKFLSVSKRRKPRNLNNKFSRCRSGVGTVYNGESHQICPFCLEVDSDCHQGCAVGVIILQKSCPVLRWVKKTKIKV